MTNPTISIVIPAFNEEGCIAESMSRWSQYLDARRIPWELVVVDDGSTDGTAALVERTAAKDTRIRMVHGPHHGKGAAVRGGMLAARGVWRFLADADLSMPADNLARFFAALKETTSMPHIVIGSREVGGSRRIGESWQRHAAGRIFNVIVRVIAVRGVRDTQCGFKLFSAPAAQALFSHAHIDGFAFDVEILFLARRAGLTVREIGIEWHARRDGRVTFARGANAFADVLRVRWNAWLGRYRGVPVALGPLPSIAFDEVCG